MRLYLRYPTERFKNAKQANELKRSFRKTKIWAELRDMKRKEQNNLDPVTHQKLVKSANLHHLSLYPDNYDNPDPSRYILLNPATHELVHRLFDMSIYETENPTLTEILKRMYEINKKEWPNFKEKETWW